MKRGETTDLYLNIGNVLSVVTDANSTALITPLGDNPGQPPQTPISVPASTVAEYGPFTSQKRYRVQGLTGDSTAVSQSLPPVLSSQRIVQASITPASVAAAICAEQAFAVVGAKVGDTICVCCGNTGNATGIAGARVSAADQVTVKFVNPTAGALTPGAGVYAFLLAH